MRTQNGTLSKYLQNAWVIIISIVAISLIAGGSVYLWKNSDSEDYEQKLHQQILLLQNQVRELQKKNTDLKTIKDSSPAISSDISSDIEFPVVSYTRQGLLTGTEEGRAEKKNLEEKLISPYADYHNENRVRVVAMYISVPKTIEENYKVIAIMGNGRTEQFFWPRKEYGYWIPGCMRPCVLSETYKTKYPQIADIVRKEIQDRKHTIPFCMAPPVSTAIGRDIYPIDPKYNTGLKFLGELFTAYICDPEDVSKIFGVDDDNNYTLNPTILLNNNPSQALISILKSIGFKCGEGNSNESCKTWILENTVKVNDLMKLEPYYKNFKADNCTNCG